MMARRCRRNALRPRWAVDYIVSYRGLPLGVMKYGGRSYYGDPAPSVQDLAASFAAPRLKAVGIRKYPRKSINVRESGPGDESDFALLALAANDAWTGRSYRFPPGEWAEAEFTRKARKIGGRSR